MEGEDPSPPKYLANYPLSILIINIVLRDLKEVK